MTQARWEHFSHQADIGVRGFGASLAEAFEQAAMALSAVMVDPAAVEPQESVRIECDAPDDELLLVDWLNALIYETSARAMVFSAFEVRIAGERLHGQARGEILDAARHRPAVEVKGATYTELSVRRQPDGSWLAQCVVDV